MPKYVIVGNAFNGYVKGTGDQVVRKKFRKGDIVELSAAQAAKLVNVVTPYQEPPKEVEVAKTEPSSKGASKEEVPAKEEKVAAVKEPAKGK